MSQLKIGVVGYGNWGKNHVRVLGARSSGVYDKAFSKNNSTNQINFYESLDELIDNVQALIISSPANTFRNC